MFWEPSIGPALVLGIGIRLVLIPWFSDPFNFWAGHLSSKLLVEGQNPFSVFTADPRFQQLGPWPYPAEYFLFAVTAFVGSTGISALYGVWLRVINVVADAGTSVLLFRISRIVGTSEELARAGAYAYLFNPFVIVVSAVWGVNDPIPVFFTILALRLFLQRAERDAILGAFALGLGIATKIYPAILLPLGLALAQGPLKKLRLLFVAAIPPLATSAPFILADGQAYAGVVFGFSGGTSGSNRALLAPQFTAWKAISLVAGPLDSRLAFLAAGALILGLFWTYRLVRGNRLDLPSAFGFVALLAYLLAVRWSPNYFLWATPFVTLHALRHMTGLRKWVVLSFWAPALVYTLIYDGWYPDAFSGGGGLPYWGLVSGIPGQRIHDAFPPEFGPGLTVATIAVVLFVAVLHLRPFFLQSRHRAQLSAPPRSDSLPIARNPNSTRLVMSMASVIFAVVFVVSAVYQSSNNRPVGPTDFASFEVLPDGSFAVADQFRADILSFRWVFHGTGSYSLHPNGPSGILLDTTDVAGTAYLENAVSTNRVSTRIVFRIESLYGADRLVILRANSSRLGVVPAGVGIWMLTFFDDAANRSFDLGTIGSGWQQANLTFSPVGQEVDALGTRLLLPAAGPIRSIDIGHPDILAAGGGRLEVGEVAMEWSTDPNALSQVSVTFVVLADVAVLLPLLLVGYPRREGVPRTHLEEK